MSNAVSKRESSRPSPWLRGGPLASLRHEMDDLFENFFGSGLPAISRENMPSLDVAETDTAVEIKTDLPGYKPEDVDIEVHDGVVRISGSTSGETETNGGDGRKYHKIERRSGSFSRSVRLPCGVNEENIDAELKDGVLTIVLPKADEAKAKKIRIKG